MPDSSKNRRPAHPHAVSSFTRKQKRDYPSMHPEGHVHMDEKYHKDTRAFNAYNRKTKKAAKGKKGGRGRRMTRRR